MVVVLAMRLPVRTCERGLMFDMTRWSSSSSRVSRESASVDV